MTAHRWQSKTGNIDEEGSWSSGVKASDWGSSDEVWIDGALSQRSLTSGLSQSGITVSRWTVTKGFRGHTGGPGNPLELFAVTGGMNYHGSGTMYYKTHNTGKSELIVIDSSNLLKAMILSAGASSGYFKILVKSGHVTADPSALFAPQWGTLAVEGIDAKLVIQGDPGGATYNAPLIFTTAGQLYCGRRQFDSTYKPEINVGGGLLQLENVLGLYRFNQSGGRSAWSLTVDPQSQEVFAHLAAGTVDLTGSRYSYTGNIGNIGSDLEILSGPVLDDATFVDKMVDLRKDYP